MFIAPVSSQALSSFRSEITYENSQMGMYIALLKELIEPFYCPESYKHLAPTGL